MNNNMKDEDILPLSPEEIKAIGSIGIGPSKQDIFLNRHYRKLIFAGIGLAVAASLAIAWFSHNNDRKQEAGAQVVAAMKTQSLAVIHPSADYDAKLLEGLQAQYADTASAPTARLLENLSLLSGSEDQVKTALAGLEALAQDASVPALLRARALCTLAVRSMNAEDDAAATTHWNTLLSLGENPYNALACLSLGDLAKNAGKVEEARQFYQQAIASCQTSQLVLDPNIVSARLMLLDVDAPRPVAPAPQEQPQEDIFKAPTPEVPSGDSLFSGGSTLPAQPQI